jgi:LemA protein
MNTADLIALLKGLGIAGLVVVAVCLYVVWTYNRLVRYRDLLPERWKAVKAQLKRRHDLVADIVEIVNGHRPHERPLRARVAQLLAESADAVTIRETAGLESELSRAVRQVLAVAETYPGLQADESFMGLHGNLAGVEDDLQLAQREYNRAARHFNARLHSFAGGLVARAVGFRAADFFEIEMATDGEAPGVEDR